MLIDVRHSWCPHESAWYRRNRRYISNFVLDLDPSLGFMGLYLLLESGGPYNELCVSCRVDSAKVSVTLSPNADPASSLPVFPVR